MCILLYSKFLIYLFDFLLSACLQVSYAIGVAEPISITVFEYGTSKKSQKELLEIVKNNFDLRPGKIVKYVTVLHSRWLIFSNRQSLNEISLEFLFYLTL